VKQLAIYLLVLFPILLFSSQSKYQDNESCKECHDKIYEEFQSSHHSKGYFNDELHRKIADQVSNKKYDCATCHMPMADNIDALISGKARPDKSNKTHTDAVSCYFCHTIAYVKEAHRFNINTKARQADGYKPTLYGRLQNPDDNDKHSSVENPVYAKKVCMGCHSHKRNENNVTIFRAMEKGQDSLSCIKCHMPELDGGADKINKRTRAKHASHQFLGIHDKGMREKSVDMMVENEGDQLKITLENKMDHPLIIQSARAKYLVIKVLRDGKVIWKNFDKHPSEDKQGYFAVSFKKNGETILIPATATERDVVNNLDARESKTFTYIIKGMQKGDKVDVALYVKLAKDDCLKAIDLNDTSPNQPLLMKEIQAIVK
jgi:hypothetical protein